MYLKCFFDNASDSWNQNVTEMFHFDDFDDAFPSALCVFFFLIFVFNKNSVVAVRRRTKRVLRGGSNCTPAEGYLPREKALQRSRKRE